MIARDRIDPNLATKKQLVLVAQWEVKHRCVFQEELTLLRNEYFERRDIERLQVDFGVSEIGIAGKVQDQIGTESIENSVEGFATQFLLNLHCLVHHHPGDGLSVLFLFRCVNPVSLQVHR